MGYHKHDLQQLETWVVENPETTLLKPWDTRSMFKKVVTLTNPASEFCLVLCVGRLFNIINTPIMIISGWLISSFYIFLLLLSLLVTSIKNFTRRRRRKGRIRNRRRRQRVNMRLMLFGWRSCIRSTGRIWDHRSGKQPYR